MYALTTRLPAVALAAGLAFAPAEALSQTETADEPSRDASDEPAAVAAAQVDVTAAAEDDAIAQRLERILKATSWYRDVGVRVDEGVVFLTGRTDNVEHKQFASELGGKTESVVAVVNRLTVDEPEIFDFEPAVAQLRSMARTAVQATPTILVAVVLLALTLLAARLVARTADRIAMRRIDNKLLGGVIAKAAAVPVLILGAYLALRVSGLTRLAATVLGGTGLLGIVIGIAFRDIAENFLASILISMQRPFQQGDLVTVAGHQGYVQLVTTRGTQLMTLDGNHVQVPNSTVYKSVIENVTANPKIRQGLVVGIDYEDSAADAQETVLDAVRSHVAVLADPEPLVLVDQLAASTVNLQIWFWIDGAQYSVLKVRSAVLRRVKKALQEGGFTMPDEAREVIFPNGVPVRMVETPTHRESGSAAGERSSQQRSAPPRASARGESAATATAAEGDLTPERAEIQEQADRARPLGDETVLVSSESVPPRSSSPR